jgi:acetyl-CoA C-acetyltransferase
MRQVFVAGTGITRFGVHAGQTLAGLAGEAGRAALADAEIDPQKVDSVVVGNFAGPDFTGQNHLGALCAGACGVAGAPALRVEAACASGGAAFRLAWQQVASGLAEQALVIGVELMTSTSTGRTAGILAGAGDMASEGPVGATFPAIFGLIANRHMLQFGTTREQLAAIAVKNHAHALRNPLAHLHKAITLEQALAGKPVAEPLTLYDCSLISDGAAAVLLSAQPGERNVPVLACAQSSDSVGIAAKDDITTFAAVRAAGAQAFRAAKLAPAQVDFAEVHDCFTIAELIALEDLGFIGRGEGGPFAAAGHTRFDGVFPVNLSGGLKAKGHPVGATGVAQIVELALQLRGEAGERQLREPKIGLAQNLGGSGATCVVTLMGAPQE